MDKQQSAISKRQSLFILGAGCWGTTLATIYAEKGYNIFLWEPVPVNAKKLSKTRKLDFFKFVILPDIVVVTEKLDFITKSDIILIATPSKYLCETLEKIKNLNINLKNKIFISCVKGLEQNTMLRPSQVIHNILSINYNNIFVFSGPSHAEEIVQHKPAAITLAGKNKRLLSDLQNILSTEFLRVYINNDIVGVELGGILKNVYAIAAGICDGLNLGDNAKSALVTRAIKEMVLVGKTLGGETKTFFGLSGLGDLLTTAYSGYSRNRTFGKLIVTENNVSTAQQKVKTTVEGILTVKVLFQLAKKYNLDLPIANEVYKIVYKNKPVKQSIKTLFSRKLKSEFTNYL